MLTGKFNRMSPRFASRTFTLVFGSMVVMGLLISLPLLGIAGWMYRTDMKRHIMELHEQTAMSLSRENASEFTAMTAPMQSVVNLVALDTIDRTTLKHEVDFIASTSQFVHDIRVVDENEAMVAGSDPTNRNNDFERFEGLETVRAGNVYKSGIIIGDELKYMVEMAWPVTRAHIYVGFVFSRIEFSRLWSGMDLIRVGPDSNVLLVDRISGRVMADQSRKKLGIVYMGGAARAKQAAGKTPDNTQGAAQDKATDDTTDISTSGLPLYTWEEDGQLISRYQIKDWPVDVVVESKMATLAAQMRDNLIFVFVVAVIWISAGCVVAFFVAGRITAPLGKLTQLMAAIPYDMKLRAEEHGGEFTLISRGLNTMLDNIQEQEKRLIQEAAVAAVGRTAAALAHDIRGGMHTIINAASLFEKKPEMARNIIGQAVQRMCNMLDDVLEFARSGSPDLAPVTIERMFANYDRSWILGERFNGRKIEVIPGELGLTAMMDLKKMVRALDNMGRNSLEAGAKNVTMTWKKDGDWVVITVRDDGPGIAKDIMGKIFTPFFSTKRGGFGIGMSIIDMVVKSHYGVVDVKNMDGGGVEITMKIPLGTDSPVRRI